MNTIYKIITFFVLLLIAPKGFSQNADPGLGILMSPASLTLGSTGILSANVGNYGNRTIVANSLRVTISVGTDAEIIGIAAGSDARWTLLTMTSGSGNTIRLKNTGGGFGSFDVGDILLIVRANVVSGPDLILGNVVYITAANPLLCGVCPPTPLNVSQGNASTTNDNSQTSLAVTFPVIDAVVDTPSIVSGGTTPSILINDTLNGVGPVVVGTNPGEVTLTSTPNGPLTVNPNGTITVAPNTPAGTYPVTYTICEVTNPTNCDSVTVTVTVTAPVIDAVVDITAPINGTTGGTTPALTANDTLNGNPVVIGTAPGNVVLTAVTVPSGMTLNPNGTVTIAPNTPAGNYLITYTLCEVTNPTNCDTVTSSIVLISTDFTPTIDIDNVVFLTTEVTRDFVVNISEIGSGPSIGQLVFKIPKQSGFLITYNATTTSSNVGGGTIVNNSDWTITENTIFITVTLKPNVIIDVNSFSSIGFSIARKLNVPNQTWQPLTATIINGTGADSDSSNNSYNVIVKAQ
jgi:hypothetical protein